MKKFLNTALVAVLLAGTITGCGGGGSTDTKTTVAAGETTQTTGTQTAGTEGKKTLRVAAVDPQVPLDMQQNTYSLIMKMTDNITESLMTTNNDSVLEPTLITALPKLSEDMLTYTFELKEGVKFHNGETLASEDVKFSLERMVKKQKMASLLEKVEGYEAFASGTAEELTGIAIQDDRNFTITLTDIYTPFASMLSTPYCAIYPKAACETAGDNWGIKELVATGPFKLDSYTAGVGAELSKFDDYHGTAAKLDGVSYKFIEDPNTQVLEYQKGNIDYVDLNTALYPVYASNPELSSQLHGFQPVGGYYFNINVKSIPDPKVREAISLSIDRTAVCESILHGTATPATSFIPSGLIGFDETSEAFSYDPEKAKTLLAEAGYANGYDLRTTVNTKYSVSVAIATAFKEQAKAAGINVSIEQVDSAAWTDMKKNGAVDLGIGNWYVDYNDPDSMLYPLSDSRTDMTSSFFHNAEYKKLMEDGIRTADDVERQDIYKRAEQILTREEFAIAPIYNETMYYLLNPAVTGFEITSTFRTFFAGADIQ